MSERAGYRSRALQLHVAPILVLKLGLALHRELITVFSKPTNIVTWHLFPPSILFWEHVFEHQPFAPHQTYCRHKNMIKYLMHFFQISEVQDSS